MPAEPPEAPAGSCRFARGRPDVLLRTWSRAISHLGKGCSVGLVGFEPFDGRIQRADEKERDDQHEEHGRESNDDPRSPTTTAATTIVLVVIAIRCADGWGGSTLSGRGACFAETFDESIRCQRNGNIIASALRSSSGNDDRHRCRDGAARRLACLAQRVVAPTEERARRGDRVARRVTHDARVRAAHRDFAHVLHACDHVDVAAVTLTEAVEDAGEINDARLRCARIHRRGLRGARERDGHERRWRDG